MVLRADLIITNWIFVWVFLYIIGLTKYSPKLAIIIAIIGNIVGSPLLKTVNAQTKSILLIGFLIKLGAFYLVRNDTITKGDVIIFILFFLAYNLWVTINNETVLGYYEKIYKSLNNNDNNTPFVNFVHKIFYIN